jgi:hypothetical protein
MPLLIKGKEYPLPTENGSSNLTGKELIEIENQFQLDGLELMKVFSQGKEKPGYTQVKALFAIAWVCLTRAGEILSINDVLNDYAVDDFGLTEKDEPKKRKPRWRRCREIHKGEHGIDMPQLSWNNSIQYL